MRASGERRLRVLVLSWNYPTPAAPQRGLWAERMCDAVSAEADVVVVVPTPWVPPLVPVPGLARFRSVPRVERRNGVEVHFPRVPGSIEYLTHDVDAVLARSRVMALVRRLHRERPFDLIHAHFIAPEGVLASRIGTALGIPVMTSEHAFWSPWLVDRASVGARVKAALPGIRLVAPVSEFLKADVDAFLHGRVETTVLPNVVDDEVFFPSHRERDASELLYVGLIRRFKRLDVLVRALALARRHEPGVHLRLLSANALRAYRKDRSEVRDLITKLGLDAVVRTVHGADPPAVAEAMRRSGLVVVSSTRRETFCCVAAEALACGTPLVVTRCGGPEEFVGPQDGVMVEPDDPEALALGIERGLRLRTTFDSEAISGRILARFGRAAWRNLAMSMYERVATGAGRATRSAG